eukprot:SAG31_NODE_2032_length_6625_cov_3.010113_1_plen_52_part_10
MATVPTEAPCPADSEGSGVVSDCTLMVGYVGNLTATTNAAAQHMATVPTEAP